MNKKYIVPVIIFISATALIIGLCYSAIYFFSPCEHKWTNATCTESAICSVCGETAGDPIDHKWADATCTEPKICIICGKTEGKPLGHDWIDATYDAPKTCSICGETEGEPLEKFQGQSNYDEPTYTNGPSSTTPSNPTCMMCGKTVNRSDTFYCAMHDCSYTGCPYPAKYAHGAYGSLCGFHSCQYPDCLSTPITGSPYCAAHIN